MLDVLNHKCNTLITTATDGGIFLENNYNLREKC